MIIFRYFLVNMVFSLLITNVTYADTDILSDTSSVSSESFLPPEPGAEGHETLAGIDSDEDGLRDDIQRLIAIKFKDDHEKIEKYRELAQYKIYFVDPPLGLDADSSEGLFSRVKVYASMKELEYCLMKGSNRNRDALSFILKLESWINSTYLRDVEYAKNLKGMPSMMDNHSHYYCNDGEGIVNYLMASKANSSSH